MQLRGLGTREGLTACCSFTTIDLLRTDTMPIAEYFINLMFSNFYQPLILQPTRCAGRERPSLIDNNFYNSIENNVISGNLIASVTDHLPNFMLIDKQTNKKNRSYIINVILEI